MGEAERGGPVHLAPDEDLAAERTHDDGDAWLLQLLRVSPDEMVRELVRAQARRFDVTNQVHTYLPVASDGNVLNVQLGCLSEAHAQLVSDPDAIRSVLDAESGHIPRRAS
jgi:hypothetical protein